MNDKKEKLLKAAYDLFITKGFQFTTIQDIVDKAGVAKGTFYLYFKDKYDIHEQLIVSTSYDLFYSALEKLSTSGIKDFKDSLIFIIDYVIDQLIDEPALIKFISKDLSLGVYSERLTNLISSKKIGVRDTFLKGIEENNIKIKNPDIILFMIIELVSSSCFSSIIYNKPLPINEYKPYLYKTIKDIIDSNMD
jgi:hypothetical protein